MTENQQLKEYRKRSTCTGHGFPTKVMRKYSQPLTERHSATCWCADRSHAVVFLIWSSFPWDLSDFEWLSTSTRESCESYVYFNMWSFKKENKKKKQSLGRDLLLFHITISPKSKNLALIHLIVILILYPYDVKLMSMSLSFYVNFCQSSSIWFVQFFVSFFLSVYIYIVHYLCLISPHGLAALIGRWH